MDSKSKNEYVDKFDNIVNKCNNTYQTTVKIMSGDVMLSMYIDFDKQNIRKSIKYFCKGLCSYLVWRFLLVILTGKKLFERFMKKDCKKQIKKCLYLKRVIKRKSDKLSIK